MRRSAMRISHPWASLFLLLIFDCANADGKPLPAGAEAFRDLFPVPFPHAVGLGYI